MVVHKFHLCFFTAISPSAFFRNRSIVTVSFSQVLHCNVSVSFLSLYFILRHWFIFISSPAHHRHLLFVTISLSPSFHHCFCIAIFLSRSHSRHFSVTVISSMFSPHHVFVNFMAVIFGHQFPTKVPSSLYRRLHILFTNFGLNFYAAGSLSPLFGRIFSSQCLWSLSLYLGLRIFSGIFLPHSVLAFCRHHFYVQFIVAIFDDIYWHLL